MRQPPLSVSDWKAAWTRLQAASGLASELFGKSIRDLELNFRFETEVLSTLVRSADTRRKDIADLADLFFSVAADPAHVVRIDASELLERLGWTTRVSLRNVHVFPVPAAYRPNERALDGLLNAMSRFSQGYLAVVAPAGMGKSSLLSATALPVDRTVSYYAFTPDSPDPSTGRGNRRTFSTTLSPLPRSCRAPHLRRHRSSRPARKQVIDFCISSRQPATIGQSTADVR